MVVVVVAVVVLVAAVVVVAVIIIIVVVVVVVVVEKIVVVVVVSALVVLVACSSSNRNRRIQIGTTHNFFGMVQLCRVSAHRTVAASGRSTSDFARTLIENRQVPVDAVAIATSFPSPPTEHSPRIRETRTISVMV